MRTLAGLLAWAAIFCTIAALWSVAGPLPGAWWQWLGTGAVLFGVALLLITTAPEVDR